MLLLLLLLVAGLLGRVANANFCVAGPSAQSATPACNTPRERQCWGDYSIHTDYSVVTPQTNIVREVRPLKPYVYSFGRSSADFSSQSTHLL